MIKTTMTKDIYDKLEKASKTLCEFCDNDACESCQVSLLMNDAYAEAVDSEIIADDQYKEDS